MRSTSRTCARRAKSQMTKHIPVKSTMIMGGTPTASSIATTTITAIAFVVSFPALVITPPLLSSTDFTDYSFCVICGLKRKLLLPETRDDRGACLFCRELSAEISGRFICRDRAANSVLDFVTQRLEAQVF